MDQIPSTIEMSKPRTPAMSGMTAGDVEIGFNQISEVVAASGVDLVGPLGAQNDFATAT
jgi:hypothetical protein